MKSSPTGVMTALKVAADTCKALSDTGSRTNVSLRTGKHRMAVTMSAGTSFELEVGRVEASELNAGTEPL